jgi:RimJ/RimL family protein N-acetyltransferase
VEVVLRPVVVGDLDALYEHQADPVAAAMAAFPSRERKAFFAHWTTRVLANPAGVVRAVVVDGVVAGNVVSWLDGPRRLVGYWIGRSWWGRGVATAALSLFLDEVPSRPLYADVATANAGSVRVLEKCGFVAVGDLNVGEDGVEEAHYELRARVSLRPYATDDLPLLVRANSPEMTAHLGGPETSAQVDARHARYVAMAPEAGHVLVVVLPSGDAAGMVVWWPRVWREVGVYEAGWNVLPEYRGRGLAVEAVRLVVAEARAEGRHRWLHAFPNVANAPSNAVCLKAGFALVGEYDFEYPPGKTMRCNDWRYDLQAKK